MNAYYPNFSSFLLNAVKLSTETVLSFNTFHKESSIYDVHKKIWIFNLSPLSTWAWPHFHPCGRPHAVDMKYTSLGTASTMTSRT